MRPDGGSHDRVHVAASEAVGIDVNPATRIDHAGAHCTTPGGHGDTVNEVSPSRSTRRDALFMSVLQRLDKNQHVLTSALGSIMGEV
jgi:hypothetical protein